MLKSDNEDLPTKGARTENQKPSKLSYYCCWKETSSAEPNERTHLLSSSCNPSGRIISTQPNVDARLRADDRLNLWNDPTDSSHMETDEDMELFNLIQKRKAAVPGSEEWLLYDREITNMRQKRHEILEKWRKILRTLGFNKETDRILEVTSKSASFSTIETSRVARGGYAKLLTQTTIFGNKEKKRPSESQRYLLVLERLVNLDSLDDFLNAALQEYPQSQDND